MYQFWLEDVSKVFVQDLIAVNRINLQIKTGERVAFIGPSGAGKTTLFRMLNCTIRPTSGRLWINGDEAGRLYSRRLRGVRRKIGTIYQQHNLVPRLKVVHNVLSGKLGRWSLLSSLLSLIRPAELELAFDSLKKVGIEEKIFTRTDELSGGQQQRVAIARVLVQDPEVTLADEPVSSVDPSLATAIINLLVEISQATSKTMLMNLHSVDLALSYFSRIIGVKKGCILFDLSADKITDCLLQDLYSGHLPDSEPEKEPDDASCPVVYY